MTYGQIKRKVLEYLNQFSVAGTEISPAYNNQSDYEHRIPNAINSALIDIRGLYPKRRAVQLNGGAKHGEWVLHTLPPDFKGICTGGVYVEPGLTPTTRFRLFGGNGILVPADGRTYWIEYFQTPEQLAAGASQSGDPDDDYEIAEDLDALEAACAYAASWLSLDDDQFNHTALQHLYEDKLERMKPPVTAEFQEIGADDCVCAWGDMGAW